MEKRKNHSVQTGIQVKRVRRIYSQIGEPLPVDVIIDLHHHLGKALELADETKYAAPQRTKKLCGKLN